MSQRTKKPAKKKPESPAARAARAARKANRAPASAAAPPPAPAPVPYFPGAQALATSGLLKLDLGCGPNKKAGFSGVDQYAFPGVDYVVNLGDRSKPWPFPDNSVEEANSSHFIEHLTATERVYFMNELYRVLVPGGKCQLVVPYWGSGRAYGDFSHQWPPICEMYFCYLNASWRAGNAPHTDIRWNPLGYTCDFDFGCGYNTHPELMGKSDDVQRFMIQFYKEAAQDIVGAITKRLPAPI